MFQSARIKLTLWYLGMIMSVSIAFSGVIYTMLNREVDRFVRAQRIRIEHDFFPFEPPAYIDDDLVTDTRNRIIYTLLFINGAILIASGGLGYILAGKTLTPIQNMIDEQHRFVSDASHELRTPLTSLKTSFEVHLRDKHPTVKELRQTITDSMADVNKLQTLTDALLKLAQYEKPGNQLFRSTVSIHETIVSAIQSVSKIALQKQITIAYDQSPGLVKGDPSSLTEVFVILLDNAIKYSGKKSTVSISGAVTDRCVTVRIKDQGTGIKPKDVPYIFDRFYRADSSRTADGLPGYGLGLSIAKQICTIHNGSIAVAETSSKGTTFSVTLPAIFS